MKKQTASAYPLDVGCRVCGRVAWGHWQYLGFGHWRHSVCKPGSVVWMEAYPLRPKEQRNAVSDEVFKLFVESRSSEKESEVD